jgi:8-amino-7-oxononanoate synthase
MKELASALTLRRARKLYRERRILDSPQGPEVVVENQRCLAFCSNDYLGLANHPALVEALQQAAGRYGVGAGAAHLVSGHSALHHALEEELAEWTGTQRALLFSTGYMANLGVASALLRRSDRLFEDRLNHASLLDAARLSGARLLRYEHADMARLAARIEAAGGCAMVASDGVFSMDGDLAGLPDLARIADASGAWLLIDDAHGLGVLGEGGRGSYSHFDVAIGGNRILMGTLGKAFGSFGAFVAGSEVLIETLIQSARTYIYTTATPPALAAATRTALTLVRDEGWRREKLGALIERFRDGARARGFALMPSRTPIQPLLVGGTAAALSLSAALRDCGILVPAIRPPTVPEGAARLRITFSAAHREVHIDRLLEALEQCLAGRSRRVAGPKRLR